MSLSIGIDIGTTGTKTVLFDTSRGILAETSRETTLFSPARGFAEADTGQWLTNVIDSIREIRSQSGIGSGASSSSFPFDQRLDCVLNILSTLICSPGNNGLAKESPGPWRPTIS